jgi:hypothetical protein
MKLQQGVRLLLLGQLQLRYCVLYLFFCPCQRRTFFLENGIHGITSRAKSQQYQSAGKLQSFDSLAEICVGQLPKVCIYAYKYYQG